MKNLHSQICILFCGLLLIVLSSFSSPDEIGEKIYNMLNNNVLEELDLLYMAKEELHTLISEMDPKPSEEQLNKVLESFDSDRESYFKIFRESSQIVDWKSATLDSIIYDYKIAKPGADEEIFWPDSQNFKVNDSDMVRADILMYFQDIGHTYYLNIDMINYKGKWKLLNNQFRLPYIMTLTAKE